MKPSITSVTPDTGHTGGRTLVEIEGSGFRLPTPVAVYIRTEPPPTVRVLFGDAPALAVWVVSNTLLRCLTPIHDASGALATSVTVTNLDDHGAPIAGESETLAAAFSFVRPRLDAGSVTARVLKAFITELRRQVIDNVNFAPNTDYDPDTGDGLNIVQLAKLPGIAITDMRMPKSQEVQNEQEELPFGETGYVVVRRPVIRDIVCTLVGVSDNKDEALTLSEVVEAFFTKNSALTMMRDEANPALGEVSFDMMITQDITVGTTTDGSNVCWFSYECTIQGIPRHAMPGLPQKSIDGAPLSHQAEPIIGAGESMGQFRLSAGRVPSGTT